MSIVKILIVLMVSLTALAVSQAALSKRMRLMKPDADFQELGSLVEPPGGTPGRFLSALHWWNQPCGWGPCYAREWLKSKELNKLVLDMVTLFYFPWQEKGMPYHQHESEETFRLNLTIFNFIFLGGIGTCLLQLVESPSYTDSLRQLAPPRILKTRVLESIHAAYHAVCHTPTFFFFGLVIESKSPLCQYMECLGSVPKPWRLDGLMQAAINDHVSVG